MPKTKTEARVLAKFQREYGAKRGTRFFYSAINAGSVKGRGIPKPRRKAKGG